MTTLSEVAPVIATVNDTCSAKSLHTAMDTIRLSLSQAGRYGHLRLQGGGDEFVCALYETLEASKILNPPTVRGAMLAYSFSTASPDTVLGHGSSAQVTVQNFSLRSKILILVLLHAVPVETLSLPQDVLAYVTTFKCLIEKVGSNEVDAEVRLSEDASYVIAFGLIAYANRALKNLDARDTFSVKHASVKSASDLLESCLALRDPHPRDGELAAVNWIMRAVKTLCNSLYVIVRSEKP